jgi:hypothetical protein
MINARAEEGTRTASGTVKQPHRTGVVSKGGRRLDQILVSDHVSVLERPAHPCQSPIHRNIAEPGLKQVPSKLLEDGCGPEGMIALET